VRPTADLALACEPEHGCITCGDEAVALRVLRVDDERGLALCEDAAGERTTIEIVASHVGPELTFATAEITKASRQKQDA